MKQYLDLLQTIKQKGTYKSPARENMPGTISLFGHQMRFDLSEGFPILTTKRISFKNIVTELLWFMKGDTNIKYLVDNGCNIWNEDAYNYYLKKCREQNILNQFDFELFCSIIKNAKNFEELQIESNKNSNFEEHSRNLIPKNYILGHCGKQYGWLWRDWQGKITIERQNDTQTYLPNVDTIDQLKELIEGLKNNPMSRRHIITAWNPATLNDMALNACHAFVQFNCRPLTLDERKNIWYSLNEAETIHYDEDTNIEELLESFSVQKYYLDCQLYQRSADVFLGVPYNISSYALLTEVLAKICNMVPGEFIHTFGDVHIYDNHLEQVNEQLKREPEQLPNLLFDEEFHYITDKNSQADELTIISEMKQDWFKLENYNPQSTIKGKLSTGLK